MLVCGDSDFYMPRLLLGQCRWFCNAFYLSAVYDFSVVC